MKKLPCVWNGLKVTTNTLTIFTRWIMSTKSTSEAWRKRLKEDSLRRTKVRLRLSKTTELLSLNREVYSKKPRHSMSLIPLKTSKTGQPTTLKTDSRRSNSLSSTWKPMLENSRKNLKRLKDLSKQLMMLWQPNKKSSTWISRCTETTGPITKINTSV